MFHFYASLSPNTQNLFVSYLGLTGSPERDFSWGMTWPGLIFKKVPLLAAVGSVAAEGRAGVGSGGGPDGRGAQELR